MVLTIMGRFGPDFGPLGIVADPEQKRNCGNVRILSLSPRLRGLPIFTELSGFVRSAILPGLCILDTLNRSSKGKHHAHLFDLQHEHWRASRRLFR